MTTILKLKNGLLKTILSGDPIEPEIYYYQGQGGLLRLADFGRALTIHRVTKARFDKGYNWSEAEARLFDGDKLTEEQLNELGLRGHEDVEEISFSREQRLD